MQPIPEFRVGQVDRFQPCGFLLRRQGHAAGAEGPVAMQDLVRQRFTGNARGRIADQQRSPAAVVTDDGLQVAGTGLDGVQGERHAALEQGLRRFLGHGKFPRNPAVALGPLPFVVGRGAVVADLLGHLHVIRGPGPEAADGRERGRNAGHAMLLDEADGKLDPFGAVPCRFGQTLGNGLEEIVAGGLRMTDSSRIIAEMVGHIRAAGPRAI